jgi:peptide deformylase
LPENLPITTYGMNILRKKAIPVKEIDTKIISLVENMFYTMRNAEGVGLAAPQVNENLAITVIDVSIDEKYKDFKPILLINPVIEGIYGEVVMKEGCLSIPEVRADVLRPRQVYVKYYDLNMKEITEEFDDLQARVIQHEIDHLNGKLFIDYLNKDELKNYKKQLSDIKKGKIQTDYLLHIDKDNFHGY